jgi:MATE family multidrug resistance protein
MFNVLAVGFMIALALGEASSVRVAFALGAGLPRGVRRSALTGIGLGTVIMLISASVLLLFPREVVSLFLDVADADNAAVVENAVVLAGIAALFQLFDGLQAVASRALRGMKDTMVPMWIASLGYWVFGVTGGWMLCFPLGYGARGLWWGLALGLMVTALALMWRLMARTRF